MIDGMKTVSVRYEIQVWDLFGVGGLGGIGYMAVRIDTMYGENVEDAMRRAANLLRRRLKECERAEIVCSADGKTQIFHYNM